MVQKALMEHGGEEGLTAEEINEYLRAANYHLSPHHDRLFFYHLYQLSQRNKIILDPSSGRYTIPGRAEVRRLTSQAEQVLCKLNRAEDEYIKNLAGAFVREFHLSKIKKLKALLAEATTASSGDDAFKIPTWTHGQFKKPTLTHGSQPKIARSLFATAGEMRGVPGPTAEQSGDETPDPTANPAGNVSVRDPGVHPRRESPMGKRPNRPDEGPGSEAQGSSSGSFKIPKNGHGLRPQQGRGGSDNPVGVGGPAVSPPGPIEPSQAARPALERSANQSGICIERQSKRGKTTVWINLPEDE
ncbi:hypothetical protein COCNU_scaffold005650G000060 [Cocos nucifera]|nr:hypothetical protein [Cocos nucifera]